MSFVGGTAVHNSLKYLKHIYPSGEQWILIYRSRNSFVQLVWTLHLFSDGRRFFPQVRISAVNRRRRFTTDISNFCSNSSNKFLVSWTIFPLKTTTYNFIINSNVYFIINISKLQHQHFYQWKYKNLCRHLNIHCNKHSHWLHLWHIYWHCCHFQNQLHLQI